MSALQDFSTVPEVIRFRDFIRIPTVSHTGPNGTYQKAIDFLINTVKDFMTTKVIECTLKKPILIATLQGSDPSAQSILLNAHYDVVPADATKWNHDPFAAELLPNGDIVGRGTQDMKSVCMQYIEALRRLHKSGIKLKRTVHISFVPDEEIGGADGMGKFIETADFASLNVGCALDEGLANDSKTEERPPLTVFYGERAVLWLKVRATGPTGHGSRFIQNTAMHKLIDCINKFLAFRQEQEAKLHAGCKHAIALKLGDVITINLTALQGGVSADGGKSFALNVIPTEAMAGFDCRVPPTVPIEDFEKLLQEWTSADGLSYEFVYRTPSHEVSDVNRDTNPFWCNFEDTLVKLGYSVVKEIFPAGTDGRYVRMMKVPVFGFSPMPRTEVLLHEHNEHLNAKTFLRGIEIYESLLASLCNT